MEEIHESASGSKNHQAFFICTFGFQMLVMREAEESGSQAVTLGGSWEKKSFEKRRRQKKGTNLDALE